MLVKNSLHVGSVWLQIDAFYTKTYLGQFPALTHFNRIHAVRVSAYGFFTVLKSPFNMADNLSQADTCFEITQLQVCTLHAQKFLGVTKYRKTDHCRGGHHLPRNFCKTYLDCQNFQATATQEAQVCVQQTSTTSRDQESVRGRLCDFARFEKTVAFATSYFRKPVIRK